MIEQSPKGPRPSEGAISRDSSSDRSNRCSTFPQLARNLTGKPPQYCDRAEGGTAQLSARHRVPFLIISSMAGKDNTTAEVLQGAELPIFGETLVRCATGHYSRLQKSAFPTSPTVQRSAPQAIWSPLTFRERDLVVTADHQPPIPPAPYPGTASHSGPRVRTRIACASPARSPACAMPSCNCMTDTEANTPRDSVW